MDNLPKNPDAHPQNAGGDFYVLNGMCIICGAPESVAPDLMSHDATSHCFFTRQPVTSEERERAVQAVRVCCCGSVRYAGSDPAIVSRLAELGCDDADHLP